MRTARDLMQTRVVTVAPHDPLHVVQRLFTQEGIHGAPEDLKERLQDAVVEDHMTGDVVQVAPSAPVAEVARALRTHQVHRVVVTENGLRGVISAFDLVALLEKG